MGAHGVLREHQGVADVGQRAAAGEKAQNLALAGGKAVAFGQLVAQRVVIDGRGFGKGSCFSGHDARELVGAAEHEQQQRGGDDAEQKRDEGERDRSTGHERGRGESEQVAQHDARLREPAVDADGETARAHAAPRDAAEVDPDDHVVNVLGARYEGEGCRAGERGGECEQHQTEEHHGNKPAVQREQIEMRSVANGEHGHDDGRYGADLVPKQVRVAPRYDGVVIHHAPNESEAGVQGERAYAHAHEIAHIGRPILDGKQLDWANDAVVFQGQH